MGVPSVFQFVKDNEAKKVVELVISQTVFHRSYIAPPETPPAQLEILRKAFDETMADPALLDDAQKMRIDIEPLPGAKVQEVVSRLYTAPKDIIERARKAIRPD
jgi:tripartite-type tricarboxylate transporter receptor subunit TctC